VGKSYYNEVRSMTEAIANIVMGKHICSNEHRRLQLLTFFASLERDEKGRLTKQSRDKRDGWLSAFGISNERARQIMKGNK